VVQVEDRSEKRLLSPHENSHNHRSDGLPDWQTLWRGMTTLQILVEGVRLSRHLNQIG